MLNKDFDFFRLPAWQELIQNIKYEIAQAQRPSDEIILNDSELSKTLKVSKRTIANLRADKEIAFHKCGGRILYKLSDVLEYVDRNRVDADPIKAKSRIK